ncbi:MAG: ferredoxin [Nanoarchaeota archaeon]
MANYKVCITERKDCMSCELCTNLAPDNFFIDEDGWANVKSEKVDQSKYQENKDAQDSCPAQIIKVEKLK